jgi:hypothetical protein
MIIIIFQQKRTEFSPEQVEMMKEAFEKGMRKGKTWASGHQELALKMNLSEIQVKVIKLLKDLHVHLSD